MGFIDLRKAKFDAVCGMVREPSYMVRECVPTGAVALKITHRETLGIASDRRTRPKAPCILFSRQNVDVIQGTWYSTASSPSQEAAGHTDAANKNEKTTAFIMNTDQQNEE